MRFVIIAVTAIAAITSPATSKRVEPRVVTVTLNDHAFSPSTIAVCAGERVKIDLTNRDSTADDFDSDDMHVDKELAPHGHASFFIGPLKAGRYAFKGELHPKTAFGEVVVSDAGQ